MLRPMNMFYLPDSLSSAFGSPLGPDSRLSLRTPTRICKRRSSIQLEGQLARLVSEVPSARRIRLTAMFLVRNDKCKSVAFRPKNSSPFLARIYRFAQVTNIVIGS